MQNKYIKECS